MTSRARPVELQGGKDQLLFLLERAKFAPLHAGVKINETHDVTRDAIASIKHVS